MSTPSATFVRMLLAVALSFACAERPTLEDREWTLVELRGQGVVALPELPLPSFRLASGEMTGFAGCNQIFGSYELDGGKLAFGPIGATRRACPDESNLEMRFLQALEATTAYTMTLGALELRAGPDRIAQLVPTEPQ